VLEDLPSRPGARAARTSRCSIASRPSATRRKTSSFLMRRWRSPARKRSARWARTRRSRRSRQVEAALHLFQAELRPGHEPADRSDPRGAGDEPRLVDRAAPQHARPRRHGAHKRLEVRQPILTNEDLEKIRCIGHFEDAFDTKTLDITYPIEQGAAGMEGGARALCASRAEKRCAGLQHHHPVRPPGRPGPHPDPGAAGDRGGASSPDPQGLRTSSASWSRPASRARCITSPAGGLWRGGDQPLSRLRHAARHARRASPRSTPTRKSVKRYIKAIGKGLLKVMSKMGISTYQSYCGAQIFDAVGCPVRAFVEKYFTGTATTIEGVGLAEIAEEACAATRAFGDSPIYRDALDVGGEYAYRLRGEEHAWTPERGDAAARGARQQADKYREEFARLVNEQDERLLTMRGLFRSRRRGDRPQARPARRGRAGQRDRQALRHRRDVASARSPRGAHHAGDRDEPHRRQVEHGRGRRGADRFKPLPNGDRCARRSSRSPRAASA
jgi:glutamate synthase (NADPH) large chain